MGQESKHGMETPKAPTTKSRDDPYRQTEEPKPAQCITVPRIVNSATKARVMPSHGGGDPFTRRGLILIPKVKVIPSYDQTARVDSQVLTTRVGSLASTTRIDSLTLTRRVIFPLT